LAWSQDRPDFTTTSGRNVMTSTRRGTTSA
jgi:hypothetical protein